MKDEFMSRDDFNSSFPSDPQGPETFSAVPQALLSGLSPERFQALQQLYQTAFEMARQKITRMDEETNQTDWLGDGIGFSAGVMS